MATVIDFKARQGALAAVTGTFAARQAQAVLPWDPERPAGRHPDARLLATGARLLEVMREWGTYDHDGLSAEQSDLVSDAFHERWVELRERLAGIPPRTMAGVHMKLRCMLFDGDLLKGMEGAIARNKLTRRQVDSLCRVRRRIWRMIKDIERLNGWQHPGDEA